MAVANKQLSLAFSRQLAAFEDDACPKVSARLERDTRLHRMVIGS
ncbi:MAG: hypothetical protein ABL928_14140 [Sphingorhabdus sp.]